MNERIRELAAAARHYTNDTVLHLERVHNRDYSFEEINEILDTKFAELIVKECASIAYKTAWDDLTLDYGTGVIPLHIHNTINKHFGVEE
jgi:hypothetical protein